MTTSDNPYASPQVQPPPTPERSSVEAPPDVPSIGRSFLKWTLACSIAAAPSFFLGSSLVHRSGFTAACGGMIAGISTFIITYVFAERTRRVQQIISWRFARRSAWIGYGTRIAASILFPIGMFLDMFCGLFSVCFVNWALRGNTHTDFDYRPLIADGEQAMVFAEFMLTTVVQGVLLNVVLFGYMIFVFGLCHLFAPRTKPR